jgi:hypothetical protein
MTAQTQAVASSFLSPIAEYLKQKRFYDAADSLLLLIRAFEFEEAVFQFITDSMDGLPYEDQKEFIEKLIGQIKWSEKISDTFFGDKHRHKLKRFADFLSQFLANKAQYYLRNNETDKASHFIDSVLKLSEEKTVKIAEPEPLTSHKHSLDVELMARKFIRTNFPEELPLFDSAWRIFKDITPKDLTQEAFSGALGIVGRKASDVKTPKVIVLFNQISSVNIEMFSGEKFREVVSEIGRSAGCSRELIEKITDFILKE